jgi:hypothetical protein
MSNINDELEAIWKEAISVYVKVVSWNLSGGTEENHEDVRQDSRESHPSTVPRKLKFAKL